MQSSIHKINPVSNLSETIVLNNEDKYRKDKRKAKILPKVNIISIIAFDTPFYNLHPSVITTEAPSHAASLIAPYVPSALTSVPSTAVALAGATAETTYQLAESTAHIAKKAALSTAETTYHVAGATANIAKKAAMTTAETTYHVAEATANIAKKAAFTTAETTYHVAGTTAMVAKQAAWNTASAAAYAASSTYQMVKSNTSSSSLSLRSASKDGSVDMNENSETDPAPSPSHSVEDPITDTITEAMFEDPTIKNSPLLDAQDCKASISTTSASSAQSISKKASSFAFQTISMVGTTLNNTTPFVKQAAGLSYELMGMTGEVARKTTIKSMEVMETSSQAAIKTAGHVIHAAVTAAANAKTNSKYTTVDDAISSSTATSSTVSSATTVAATAFKNMIVMNQTLTESMSTAASNLGIPSTLSSAAATMVGVGGLLPRVTLGRMAAVGTAVVAASTLLNSKGTVSKKDAQVPADVDDRNEKHIPEDQIINVMSDDDVDKSGKDFDSEVSVETGDADDPKGLALHVAENDIRDSLAQESSEHDNDLKNLSPESIQDPSTKPATPPPSSETVVPWSPSWMTLGLAGAAVAAGAAGAVYYSGGLAIAATAPTVAQRLAMAWALGQATEASKHLRFLYPLWGETANMRTRRMEILKSEVAMNRLFFSCYYIQVLFCKIFNNQC